MKYKDIKKNKTLFSHVSANKYNSVKQISTLKKQCTQTDKNRKLEYSYI